MPTRKSVDPTSRIFPIAPDFFPIAADFTVNSQYSGSLKG
jgi:hypothetical protein